MDRAPARILLVSDGLVSLDALRTLLSNDGHMVAVVTRPSELVEEVQENKPDIVVMGVHILGMYDSNICRQITRVNGGNVKVILHGPREDMPDADAAKEMGVCRAVEISPDFSRLRNAIAAIVWWRF